MIHDAHEPVVTKRTFYLAQKALLIDTRAAPRATTVYPLSGLLECGECGNAVTRSTINNGYKLYSYFRCSVRTKENRCELKQVPEAQVEAAVLQLLQEHISAVVELDRCLSEIQQVPYQKINVAKCEQRREKLAAEIARYRDLKASLYEDMKEGLISKTDFCDIRGQYDARIADALIAQEQIDRELSIYLSGEQSTNNWMKTFTEHRGLKSLTRAVVLECIENALKNESNSVFNQRRLLQDYYDTHESLHGYKVIVFCDDGVTGTHFDRPKFDELIEMARNQEIHCIMVKDLSRFGRNFLEMGNYLELILPRYGVRFISINDAFDSDDYLGVTGGLELALRNLINNKQREIC